MISTGDWRVRAAALLVALVTVLGCWSVSASAAHGPETRVRAIPIATAAVVGQQSSETAGSVGCVRPETVAMAVGSCVATEAGGALKGAITDAVPANLTEQLALTEARASGGTQIMANLVDEPRLVAVYGEGEWVKMQSVLRGTDANTTVHWFKNLTTGLEVEFKFK